MSHLSQLQADFQAYLMDDVKGAAFKAHIINDKKVGAKKTPWHILRRLPFAHY